MNDSDGFVHLEVHIGKLPAVAAVCMGETP